VVRLSERLVALAPHGLGHCFYASDGSSAVEIALKMSFHYWRNRDETRTRFVSLANSYHGETLGALSVGDVALYRETYEPLLLKNIVVPSPDAYLREPGESAAAYARRAFAHMEEVLARHAHEMCAVIVEPLVQCAGSMRMYDPVYLSLLRDACDRYNVHLIADEIAVGFGRTGTLFACEQAPGVGGTGKVSDIADFVCLSKGITGGYLPLSCVLTTDEVYAAFFADETARGFLHSHSYTGNPLACRAALAVLDIFETDRVLENNQDKAKTFTHLLAPVATHPRVRHFRQTGMIWAFDVADAQPGFARWFHQSALEEGVFIRPIGSSVYCMPPYVLEAPEWALLAETCLKLLDRLED
jgi:adenosylmethionine-8-amino-7-oxononanoate aminotransferase